MSNPVKACAKCSTINDPSANFCRICGEKLPAEVLTQEPVNHMPTEPVFNQPAGTPPVSNQPVENQTAESQPVSNQPVENQTAESQPVSNQPVVNQTAEGQSAPGQPPVYQQPLHTNPMFDDTITDAEMIAYIGPKSDVYFPKFKMMNACHSKTGFNVLVFLFGLFFSPIAASFWFFHRRMNKIGAIILSIGIALTACSIAIAVPMMNSVVDFTKQIVQDSELDLDTHYNFDFDNGDFSYYNDNPNMTEHQKELLQNMMQSMFAMYPFLMLFSLAGLATTIVASIKANYWYKESAVRRIHEIKSSPDSSIQTIAIAGGTNPIPWIIALIGYVAIMIAFITIFTWHFVSSIMSIIPTTSIY